MLCRTISLHHSEVKIVLILALYMICGRVKGMNGDHIEATGAIRSWKWILCPKTDPGLLKSQDSLPFRNRAC